MRKEGIRSVEKESRELVEAAKSLIAHFNIPSFPACGNLSHLDNLPGARVYVRNADYIFRFIGHNEARFLDWGCGYGQMAWLLANRNYRVTATDLPGFRYQDSGLLDHPLIDWVPLTDSARIEMPQKSFDVIVASGVLEHVPNIQSSLKELCRILKPGGYLFIFRFPNSRSYIEWYSRHSNTWHHPIRMTPFEIEFLTKMNGLEVIHKGYDTILPVNCMSPKIRWLRSCRERFDPFFTWLDRILIRLPIISMFSTSIWLIAKKINDYDNSK